MRFFRIFLIVMMFLIISSGLSHGSLGQGHIYIAKKLLAKMPTQLGILIDHEKNAYLAGANGVDIVYWGYYRRSGGEYVDQHRNENGYHTGAAALEILRLSKDYGFKEEAFAVGWLTHWLVDAYVHTLIGHYGGDYGIDGGQNKHTQLEIVESRHLCSTRPGDCEKSALAGLNDYALRTDHVPKDFLKRLYDEKKLTPGNFDQEFMKKPSWPETLWQCSAVEADGDLLKNLLCGVNDVGRAIRCCQLSCSTGAAECIDPRDDKINGVAQAWKTKSAVLLSNADYDYINKAIRILDPKIERDNMTVEVEVNDTNLYGKFIVEWDRVVSDLEKFIEKEQLFQKVQNYLGDEKARQPLEAVLKNISNILTPKSEMTRFDPETTKRYADGTLRGPPDITRIHYEIASTCDGGGTFNKLQSNTVPIAFHAIDKQRIKLFGSKSGSVVIDVTLEGDEDKACQYMLLVSLVNPDTGVGSYMLGTAEEGGVRKLKVLTRNPTAPADTDFKFLEYDWVHGEYKKSTDLKSRAEAKYEWMKKTIPYLEELIQLDEKAFTDLEKKVRKEVLGGVASGKYGAPPVPKECSGKSRDEMARRIAEIEKELPNTYKCGMFLEDPLTKEKRWGCIRGPQYQKLANERSVLEICLKGQDPVNYWELKCIDTPVRERWEHKEMLKAKLAAARDSKAYRFFKEYAGYNDYKGYLKEIEGTKQELDLPDPVPSPAVLPWTYYSSVCGVGGAVQEAGKLHLQLTKYPEKNTYYVGEKITFTAEATSGKDPYSYEWTGDYEGKDKSVAIPLSKIGQNRLKVSVRDSVGTMGDAVVTFEVVALQMELIFEPKEPYVGQELKAKLAVMPEAKEIEFRWMPLPDNAKPTVEAKDGGEIAFTLNNDNPAEIKVRAMTPKSGGVLGEGKNTIKAKKYTVNVTGPKAMGPKPKVWKEGVGLVDVEKEIAVDQVVEFAVDTMPAALTGPVKYKWTAKGDSCALSNATSRAARATASAAGGCALSVVITDRNDVQLGEGKGSFNATITREEIRQGQEKAKNVEDAKKKVQDAKVKERKGDLDGAIVDVDGALKLDEKNREAAALSAKFRKDRETIGIQLGKARTLMGENRFPDAQRELIVAKNLHGLWPPVLEADRELGDKWRAYDGQVRDKVYEVRSASEKKEFGKALEIAAAWRASTKLDPYAERELKEQEDWAKQWNAQKDRQIAILKAAGEKVKAYDYTGALKSYEEGFANGQNIYNGTEPEYKEAFELRNQAFTKNKRLGELFPVIQNAAENRDVYYNQNHVLEGALKASDEAIALQPNNEQLKKWRGQIVARAAKAKEDNDRIAAGRKHLDAARNAENSFLSQDSYVRGDSGRWGESIEGQMQASLGKAIENYRESLKYIPDAAVEKHIRELEATLEGRKKFVENVQQSKQLRTEADGLVRDARSEASFEASQEKFTKAIEKYNQSLGLYRPPDEPTLRQIIYATGIEKLVKAFRKFYTDCGALEREGKIVEALAACEKAVENRYPEVHQGEWILLGGQVQNLRSRVAYAKKSRAQGEGEERAGKITEAVASYRNSLKNVPDPALEEHVKRLEAGLAEANLGKTTADRLWQEGVGLYSQGQYGAALDKFKESLGHWSDAKRAKYVQDIEARKTRAKQLRDEGYALQQKNQAHAAIGKYRESLNYWPDKNLEEYIRQLAAIPPATPVVPPQTKPTATPVAPPSAQPTPSAGVGTVPARDILTSKVWQFGRSDGTVLASKMRLLAGGRIEGATHSNESQWAVVGNELLFYDSSGKAATRYNSFRQDGGRWVISGPFLLWGDITHVLREIAEGGSTATVAPVGSQTTVTPTPPVSSAAWSGAWMSDPGPGGETVSMTLTPSGNRVSGAFRVDEPGGRQRVSEGVVEGSLSGGRLSGTFRASGVSGSMEGTMEAGGNSFTAIMRSGQDSDRYRMRRSGGAGPASQPPAPPVTTTSQKTVVAEITNKSNQNTHIFPDGEAFSPSNRFAPGEKRKVNVSMKADGSVVFKAGRNGQVMATKTWRGNPGDSSRVPVVVFDESNPYDKLTVTTGLR